MGKKNNGSIGQQNKQLMKEICSEWNSKYRQEMRDDVYGRICHLAENDILYYRRKDGKTKLDGNVIAKMEMQSSTLYLYDNIFVQRENGEYMGVIPYAFELAYQFFADTILEFIPRSNKAFVNPCWNIAKNFIGQDRTIIVPDAKTLIDCLGRNPNYKQLKFFKRRQQVLDHIPSDMTELFPLSSMWVIRIPERLMRQCRRLQLLHPAGTLPLCACLRWKGRRNFLMRA